MFATDDYTQLSSMILDHADDPGRDAPRFGSTPITERDSGQDRRTRRPRAT